MKYLLIALLMSGITHSTPSDASFSVDGAAAWDAEHVVPADLPGLVPVGGIIMWSGTIANIPTAWALCDGTANAPGPDLRNQFIVGAQEDSAGVPMTNLTGSLTATGGNVSHHHADHVVGSLALSSHALSQNVSLSSHSGAAVSAHSVTQPVVSAHSITQPVVSTHVITQPVVSAHVITQPVVAAHVITQPVIGSHVITQPVIANHTLTTNVGVTVTQATVASAASGTTRNIVMTNTPNVVVTQPVIGSHSITTSVALSAHALTTNVAIADHTLSTNVAIADHSLGTNVAIANHTLTTNVSIADHTLATSVAIADHVVTQPIDHVVTQPAFSDHAITQPTVGPHDTLSAPQPYYALAFIQRMT